MNQMHLLSPMGGDRGAGGRRSPRSMRKQYLLKSYSVVARGYTLLVITPLLLTPVCMKTRP